MTFLDVNGTTVTVGDFVRYTNKSHIVFLKIVDIEWDGYTPNAYTVLAKVFDPPDDFRVGIIKPINKIIMRPISPIKPEKEFEKLDDELSMLLALQMES